LTSRRASCGFEPYHARRAKDGPAFCQFVDQALALGVPAVPTGTVGFLAMGFVGFLGAGLD